MNNTKLATKTLRMQYWAEIIQDRIASGRNVIQYCQEHGISRNAYFYWLKKLKNAALDSAGIDFVELPDPGCIQRKPDNAHDFDTEAVVSVVNVNISINSHTSSIRGHSTLPYDIVINLVVFGMDYTRYP